MDGARITRITVVMDGDEVCIRCSGEIDLVAAPRLRTAVDVALELGTSCWIDLRNVDFIDSSGIHQLLYAQRQAVIRSACLLIAPARTAAVMRPFELLGLMERLPFAFRAPRPQRRGRFTRHRISRHVDGIPVLVTTDAHQSRP